MGEERVYNFKFTSMELQIILKGLREVPYKESANLIYRLVEEYEKQSSITESKEE